MKPAAALTAVLGGLAGILGLALAWQLSGLGGSIEPADAPVSESPVQPGPADSPAVIAALSPYKEYDVITQKPLFTESREPYQPPPEVPVEEGPDLNVPEPVKLDVRVTGVIISPQIKVALLSDNASKRSMAVREGMPLDGELAAWEVDTIYPRRVAFRSAQTDETAEVELAVNGAALSGGTPAPARRAATNADREDENEPEGEQTAESRAEELRRKVAERRAQLRAEAARRAEEKNN